MQTIKGVFTQATTTNPTLIELVNDLGTISFERLGVGYFKTTLPVSVTEDSILFIIGGGSNQRSGLKSFHYVTNVIDGQIHFHLIDNITNLPADNLVRKASFILEVY